tara:strand:- start:97 stop:357 length:261 start_codon:yes stop_codon:yes gene_type:complete
VAELLLHQEVLHVVELFQVFQQLVQQVVEEEETVLLQLKLVNQADLVVAEDLVGLVHLIKVEELEILHPLLQLKELMVVEEDIDQE